MKQLLLRVPPELHARLTSQALATGTSVNALANQILGLGIDPNALSRRDRLKLKLVTIGTVGRNLPPAQKPEPPRMTQEEVESLRERAIESLRGVGPIADELIAHERGSGR